MLVGVSSSALVVRDVGEEGDFPFPLDVCPPVTPLDWALYSVKNVCPVVGVFGDKDQTMALLTAISEANLREVKGGALLFQRQKGASESRML